MKLPTPWRNYAHPLLTAHDALDAVFLSSNGGGPVVPATYAVVAAYDFGRIVNRRFLGALKCMAERTGSAQLLVAAIDPDPVEYYQRHFGAVPTFNIGLDTSEEEFIRNLHWAPEGWGDSIASQAEKVVILAENMSWVILGERCFELARLFVRQDIVRFNLQNCLPAEWRYDQDNLLECLLGIGLRLELARTVANQLLEAGD